MLLLPIAGYQKTNALVLHLIVFPTPVPDDVGIGLSIYTKNPH
jgi:hypothetical protein